MKSLYKCFGKMVVACALLFIATIELHAQTANFTINNFSQCQTGNSFAFTNTSTGGATAYQWSFGDGATSSAINPTHSYTNYGNYSVQLIATYGGINYYVNKTVEVNAVPVCGYTYTASTMNGLSYTFVSTTTIGSGSMGYTWDFGDGSSSTLVNPTHTFAANGNYAVSLIVTSDKGCTCSTSQIITVAVSAGGANPPLGFTINNTTQCLSGNSFSFTNTSTAGGATYSWDFGDGSASAAANPTHSYSSAGTYIVKLIANISGTNYYYPQQVTVTAAPTASIANGTYCTGSPISITSSSSNIASIQWKNGSTVVGTSYPVWNNTSTIVAGNNGVGSGTNQFVSYGSDVYVDKQGNIYVIDDYQSKVKKYAAGSTTWTLVATGTQITGVGVDDAGNLYTVDDIHNWVQKWASGSLTPATVAGGNGLGAALNQLHDPRGNIYIAPNGSIYINDGFNYRVVRWDVGATSGVVVAGGNGQGNAANQIGYSRGFYVDAAGNIYVADRGNFRISYWAVGAANGVTVAGGNGQGNAADQFFIGPQNVWVDAAGNIYATDDNENRMRVFTPLSTNGVAVFNGGSVSGSLDMSIIYFDQQTGCIYQLYNVGSPFPSNVMVNKFCSYNINQSFTPSSGGSYSAIVSYFGSCGNVTTNAVTVNTTPAVASITGTDEVCAGNNIILSNATAGGTWSSSNTGIATVNSGGGVTGISGGTTTITYTVTNSGCSASTTKNIVVNALPTVNLSDGGACASALTANISGGTASSLVWTLNGTPQDTVFNTYNTNATTVAGGNGSGNAANQLNSNMGIFIDAFGNLYVADNYNSRVQKFINGSTTGVTVAGGNGSGSALNQLSNPRDVFVDGNGNIYVADGGNNRVMKFASGNTTGVVVAGGNGSGNAANQLGSSIFGIYVDAAGNVYVSDGDNHRVMRWDVGASTGVVVAGGNGQGNAANQLNFNWGIYVDAAANVYVADAINYRIQKWASGAANGVTVAGALGSGPPDSAHLSFVTDVYADASGTLYISDYFHRITRWQAGADYGTTIAGTNFSGGSGASEFQYPNSLTFDAAGNLYVSDGNNNRVQKFSVASLANTYTANGTGTYCASAVSFAGCSSSNCASVSSLGVTPTISIVAGNGCQTTICSGSSVTFNSNITNGGASPTIQWKINGSNVATGTSFTTSSLNNNDVVTAVLTSNATCPNPNPVTSNSVSIKVNATPGATISGSTCTGAPLTVTGSGIAGSTVSWLLAGSPVGSSIPTFATNATTVAGALISGNGATQLNDPYGIFVDASSNTLYVNDMDNYRVQKLSIGSLFGTTIAGTGTYSSCNLNEIQQGYGIFVDKNGNVYIADANCHRIVKWAPGATVGVIVAGTGIGGNSATQLYYPKSVCIDDCGNMYVADTYNHRVQKFAVGSTTGVTVAGNGVNGSSATQLSYPTHVQVDAQGNIYVADDGNNRVQKFAAGSLTGVTVAGNGTAGNANNQLNNPWGIYVDGAGNVYVADTYNNRIMFWANGAATGVKVAGTGSYGNGANGLNYPTRVFVDANGNLYVADSHNNRVQQFAYTGSSSFTPGSAGSYTAVVTNANGCSTTTSVVNITSCVPNPSPSFTVNTTNQCITGNNFVFTNTSTAPGGTTYLWQFGDGTTSTATSPTHIYTNPGYYYVQMIATYNGQNYYASGQSIYVGPVPVASFTQYFNNSLTYTFNSTSTVSSGSIASYSWNFGDGGTATTSNPQHTFASAGSYNVTLTVTTDAGCTATITNTVTISTTSGGGGGATPSPSFTVNAANQCITGNSFVFTNTSTAPGGTTYLWQFGDGTTSAATSPTHTYTTGGYYYVQMIATYNGQNYYASGQLIVVGPKPVAAFYSTGGTGTGNAFTFYNQSTINNGSMSYSWDFGDGGISTLVSPSHTFSGAGTYNVKLVVTSNLGCKDSIIHAVVVCPTLITAFGINSASNCLAGNFFGVINYSSNNAGAPMTYSWNYDDGFTSTLQNPPNHSYAAAGTYNITLTTTLTYAGCAAQSSGYTLTATVHPMPVANFNISGSSTTMCFAANNYTFNNATTIANGSMSFAWDFGDTTYSSLYSPSHSYTHAGYNNYYDPNYGEIPIKLVATSNNNCKDSISKVVTLYRLPTINDLILNAYYGNADYPLYNGPSYFQHASYVDDTIQCFNQRNWFGHNVVANFTSLGDNVVYNFGDGTSYTGFCCGVSHSSPYKYYAAAGNYTESAYVVSNKGCVSNTVYNKVILTPNTDTLPHSVIGLHPIITTNVGIDPYLSHSYDHYKVNYASLSTTACRPIVKTEWTVTMVGGNPYHNHGTQVYQYNSNSPATSDSAYFAFDVDTSMMPTVNITLITTNDLGIKDTAHASLGATNSGYTNYRATQHIPVSSIAVYPNPVTTVVNVAIKAEKNTNTILYIYNSVGQLIQQSKQYILGNIAQNINTNVMQLPGGVYYIILKDNSNNIIGKSSFIKVSR